MATVDGSLSRQTAVVRSSKRGGEREGNRQNGLRNRDSHLTLYAFSTENQNRPGEEKSGLMRLLEEFLKRELKNMMGDDIRLRAIGDLKAAEFAQKAVTQTIEKTKGNESWNLTLALNYGSRQEILQAVQSIARRTKGSTRILTGKPFQVFCRPRTSGPRPDHRIRANSASAIFFSFRLLMRKSSFLRSTGPTSGKAPSSRP